MAHRDVGLPRTIATYIPFLAMVAFDVAIAIRCDRFLAFSADLSRNV